MGISLPESVKSQIIPLYNKEGNCVKVARILNISCSSVQKYISKNNIQKNPYAKRLYSLNDNYFETIDCQNKAYWLGWIAADGCLHKDKRHNSFITKLSITVADKEILEYFKYDINYSGNIHIYQQSNRTKHVRNNKPTATITITSKKIFHNLIQLGQSPRKSLTLQFPTSEQVPDHLLRHFIRGYFDGDGCVTQIKGRTNKKNITLIRPVISFCGTKEFLESLREWLRVNGIITKSALVKRRKNNTNAYSLVFTGKNRSSKFYDLIYSESQRNLARKREKLEKLIQKNADVLI